MIGRGLGPFPSLGCRFDVMRCYCVNVVCTHIVDAVQFARWRVPTSDNEACLLERGRGGTVMVHQW